MEKVGTSDSAPQRVDALEPMDFVYCGLRLLVGEKLGVAICPIREGKLQQPWFLQQKSKVRWSIGGIYTGASFNESTVRGHSQARFVRRWDVTTDLIDWQARHDLAESTVRSKKLEADARRTNEIEVVLLPLRQQYETYRHQRDHAGMEALAAAVLRALRTAPRVEEKTKTQPSRTS